MNYAAWRIQFQSDEQALRALWDSIVVKPLAGIPRPRRSVYLAGPAVFYPGYAEHVEEARRAFGGYGWDVNAPEVYEPGHRPAAAEIFKQNVELIRRSSAVVADIRPFRGPDPDAGTAFEVGYAAARGVPVFAYTPLEDGDHARRVARHGPVSADGRDGDGAAVEDFGLPCNLMVAFPAHKVYGGLHTTAAAVFRVLGYGLREDGCADER